MLTKDDQIVEGDRVTVYWENVQGVFDAEVLHAAQGPGEVWILKERDVYKDVLVGPGHKEKQMVRRGSVHYVMSFSRMTKNFPGDNPAVRAILTRSGTDSLEGNFRNL